MIKSGYDIKQVSELLKKRYKTDESFQETIDHANTFYGRKFLSFTKDTEEQAYIAEHLQGVISSQFSLGFYLMAEILADPEFSLDASMWELGKGYIRNSIYELIAAIMEDSEVDWQRSEEERKFARNIMDHIYEAFGVTVQMRKDMLALGAYYAFLEDSRYRPAATQEETFQLGTPYDLVFLNPQVYMTATLVTPALEKWTLNYTDTVKPNQWVGDVQLSNIFKDGTEEAQLLDVKLSNLLTEDERTELINTFIQRIPKNKRMNTTIHNYVVESFEMLLINGQGN